MNVKHNLVVMPSPTNGVSECIIFFRLSVRLVCLFVRPFVPLSGQVLLPTYLINGLSNLNETYRNIHKPPAPTDDLIRFWRLKVKGQGHGRPSISNFANTISHGLLEQSQ